MAKRSSTSTKKIVSTLKHDEAKRRNIPTAEYQSVVKESEQKPVTVKYPRNTDLDPQLVWRGKDEQDWSDLVVQAPPLYIQEKVHPKVLIDDLLRQTKEGRAGEEGHQVDMFGDFNGIPEGADKTDFYQHDQNWSNRMILGDSLQVMASLAEREGLRGKVQCIYFDPPYGIKFNSNFQWSTTSRGGSGAETAERITREPEQVKAFRDTWRDGIHSYLGYLRDRLIVAHSLLSDTGSLFLQIGDENVHRVRVLLDEVFGDNNFVTQIAVKRPTMAQKIIRQNFYYVLWYAKDVQQVKSRKLFVERRQDELPGFEKKSLGIDDNTTGSRPLRIDERQRFKELSQVARIYQLDNLVAIGSAGEATNNIVFRGVTYSPGNQAWKSDEDGIRRLATANRLEARGGTLCYKNYLDDYPVVEIGNLWEDTAGPNKEVVYVVQTKDTVIQRCILMSTDPGDLVLDPTCGSGTTAYVAEQWGRRWITVDTSRVALALARARLMGARFPYYLLADSNEGKAKLAELDHRPLSTNPTLGRIRQGFVYARAPHIKLSAVARNAAIDMIAERWREAILQLTASLNVLIGAAWREWEIPQVADQSWSTKAKVAHARFLASYSQRQREIDAAIASAAEYESLRDMPYEDRRRIRVAGPFTVESLSPHRTLAVDENDELIDTLHESGNGYESKQNFSQMILENLRTAGVQQAHREDRITFTALVLWPGALICAEGRYMEGQTERRAGIFIGPEFGTVQRVDLVGAAREAAEAGFDVLITCAFNYEAHTTEFTKLGRLPVLKARMNADLHMSNDLKNTGKGNLFVIFGEPDIDLMTEADGRYRIKVKGVDVFKPQTGEVVASGPDEIACWFLDTDYDEESFRVRHAYFLGANDPYGALKTTLKAEIDPDAWATLHSDTSRPFERPGVGRVAVKVINHLGDEVMKVFRV